MVLPRGFQYSVVLDVGYSQNVVTDILVQRKGVLPSRKSTKPSERVWVLALTPLPMSTVLWVNIDSRAEWVSVFSWGRCEDCRDRTY